MLFCPNCANLLLIEQAASLRFYCKTCPYVFSVEHKVKQVKFLEKKAVDDVMGGQEAWKDVDQTDETCPKCGHTKAYFMMI